MPTSRRRRSKQRRRRSSRRSSKRNRYRASQCPEVLKECRFVFCMCHNSRDIVCIESMEIDRVIHRRCYYRSKSQGMWRLAMIHPKDPDQRFRKGTDYTSTTLVHPSLQSWFTRMFEHNDKTHEMKQMLEVCRKCYGRLYVRVNSEKRKQKVISGRIHKLGDDLFESSTTMQTVIALARDESTPFPNAVRSQCLSSKTFYDERHLLVSSISRYLSSMQINSETLGRYPIDCFGGTQILQKRKIKIQNPTTDSEEREIIFYTMHVNRTDSDSGSRRTFKYTLCAAETDTDTSDELALLQKYIPLGLLGQKPYEYIHQSNGLATVPNTSGSHVLDRQAPEVGPNYRFVGDLTSMMWPNDDTSLFERAHPDRPLCPYKLTDIGTIQSILSNPAWLNAVLTSSGSVEA